MKPKAEISESGEHSAYPPLKRDATPLTISIVRRRKVTMSGPLTILPPTGVREEGLNTFDDLSRQAGDVSHKATRDRTAVRFENING